MPAPTVGTPGAADPTTGSSASTTKSPGAPASSTNKFLLGILAVASAVDPAAGTNWTKKYGTNLGSPAIIVQTRRNTGGAEPTPYSWPTGSGAGQSAAQIWPITDDEGDADPFHTDFDAQRQTATATFPATTIEDVPKHATVFYVAAAGSARTVGTPPSVNGTPMTRLTPTGAQLWHLFKLEDYTPPADADTGDITISGLTQTGGNVALTALLFAINPSVEPAVGAAAGTYGWDGEAVGLTPEVSVPSGSAAGTFGWSGEAVGATEARAAAAGTYGWAGAAQGPVSYTETIEDWADLNDVNDTGVQVVGNRLYASGGTGTRGYVKALPFPTEGSWRYQQLIYNVDAGLQNPTIKLGVSCGDPDTGIVADDPNAVGIAMQFATRARSSFKGSALSAVSIEDEQIVGVGPSVDAVLLLDITADEHFISFSLKDVAAVREMIAFRISRAALADAGKTVNKVYAFFTDARTTSGSSLSPFIFQTGSIGPSQTGTVAGQKIEGRGQRIITTKLSDASPMEWWAATPPDMTDDTPVIIHCPQSLTGDGHDAWTDTRMEPITAAVMDEYIWLSSTDTVDRFGNQVELDNYTALLDWCETHFGAGRDVFLFGTSMGTMVCVNLLGRGIGRALAVIGFAGGFDWLWNNVTEKRPEIRDAFGVASDGSDLRAKTTGYDPLLDFIDDPDFDDKGFRFYTGSSDAITPTELSEDMAAIALDAGATEAEVIEGSGGHLDSSQYHGDEVVAFYQRNASPAIGSAAGTFGWDGEAAGVAPSEGAAAGTFGWDGAAAGRSPRRGDAAGAYGWDGTAVGASQPQGSAAGAFGWDGAVVGRSTPRGSAAGAFGWAGTSEGHADHRGAAAGAYGWDGAAEGHTIPQGSADGTYGWAGQARSGGAAIGEAAGTYGWTGEAQGHTEPHGSAAGVYGWDGEAQGSTPASEGHAAGTFGWDGAAAGHAVPQGHAAGVYGWDGEAQGTDKAGGSAAGTFGWTGEAAGHAEHRGQADGAFGWDGDAHGAVPAPQGHGAGSFGWVGGASGRAAARGTAAGTFGWDGAATGVGGMPPEIYTITIREHQLKVSIVEHNQSVTIREAAHEPAT